MGKQRKKSDYQKFMSRRLSVHTAAGLSPQEAMRQISTEWKAEKAGKTTTTTKTTKEAKMPKSKMTGGKTYTFHIPAQAVTDLNPAVSYDICRGILAALREGAATRDAEGSAAEAVAILKQVRGETPEADSTEYNFGLMVGRMMWAVCLNEGVRSPEDWAALLPAKIQESAGDPSWWDAFVPDSVEGALGLKETGDSALSTVAQGAALAAQLGLLP